MDANRLKLNEDKTQFMWFGTRQQLDKISIWEINLPSSVIKVDQTARDLGVILDSRFSMSDHINSLSKSCFYQCIYATAASRKELFA